MASCLVRRSFLTRGVQLPSQASNWRVALTTFIVRHDRGRSLGSQMDARSNLKREIVRQLRGFLSKAALPPASDNESAQTRCLPCNTLPTLAGAGKLFVFIFMRLVCVLLLDSAPGFKESVMQMAITAMAVIAGMILSLAVHSWRKGSFSVKCAACSLLGRRCR